MNYGKLLVAVALGILLSQAVLTLLILGPVGWLFLAVVGFVLVTLLYRLPGEPVFAWQEPGQAANEANQP